MSDEGLFISEVLKGFTTGIMQGVQMRHDRADKDREFKLKERGLDIQEKGLLEEKALKEMEIGRKTTELLSKENMKKMEIAVKMAEVDRKQIADQLEDEYKKEKLGLENQVAHFKQMLDLKDLELDKIKTEADATYKKEDIAVKRERLQQDAKEKEKDRLLKEKELAAKERIANIKSKDGQKKIPIGMLGSIKEGARLPGLLKSVNALMPKMKDDFGPIEGRARMLNPYDDDAQEFKTQTNLLSETLTKYLQGSRPSDYDAKRYQKLVPRLSDKYSVAVKKYRLLDQAFRYEQRVTYELLKGQGYDTKGMPVPQDAKDPITGRKASNVAKKLSSSQASQTGYKLGQVIERNGKKYKVVERNGVKGLTPVK